MSQGPPDWQGGPLPARYEGSVTMYSTGCDGGAEQSTRVTFVAEM